MIERGRLTRIVGGQVYVEVPRLAAHLEHGPCDVIGGLWEGAAPGDAVAVTWVADIPDDLIVVGAPNRGGGGTGGGDTSGLAPLVSPVFTGNPRAPTALPGDADTSIATTAFVAGAVAPLVAAIAALPPAPDLSPYALTAFVTSAVGLLVPKALVDAKGDLLVGTANDTVARLAVGANGLALLADSAQTTGLRWGTAGGPRTLLFKIAGTLVTGVGATRLYNDTGSSWTVTAIRASVETAPSGGSVVVDVNKNGVTLFTTQANRPTVTTGLLTSGKVTNADVTSVADGDYLSVDVDTITAPAANLTVSVVVS